MAKPTAQTTEQIRELYEKIEQLEDEIERLQTLLAEECTYHKLRANDLKRELLPRDIDVD